MIPTTTLLAKKEPLCKEAYEKGKTKHRVAYNMWYTGAPPDITRSNLTSFRQKVLLYWSKKILLPSGASHSLLLERNLLLYKLHLTLIKCTRSFIEKIFSGEQ